ncbi:hypothetical protein [Cerasicoccus frondis]|uniref:hypothetical protein n=1 Tax=Cerasicoccus frondis TaxID=490090 RepID=UPI0028528268|nr:hypothetical protein [Cerasicoccus frondis]
MWRSGLLALLVATSQPCAAQEEETITLQFQTLSWQQSIQDLYYFDSGQPVKIFVPNGAPSSTQTYTGPPTLGFYTKHLGEDAQASYQLSSSVKLSKGLSKCLLLFLPTQSPDSGPRYKILPLDDNANGFGANAMNFYNLTDARMAVRIGGSQFELKPGANKVLQLSENDSKNVDVQMASNPDNTNWSLIYQSRWAAPGHRRAWVFVYQETGSRPSIRKYYQIVDVEPVTLSAPNQ